ncbi:MAG: glycosyltransferase, partial [Candidatus Pacebacteria bacterium]|nr:glycosyltransferase [Candidatus Paceibacterota bacterium]
MERKKKIVFIATKGDQGGAQKYIKQLVFGIDKNKFEPEIISGNYGASLVVKNKLKWLGNESGFLFYKDFLALIELFRVLKKEKPEIVHLNSSKAGVIGALAGKLAGVKKIIFTAHGWVFSDENLSSLKRFFYILAHKAAGFFQDKIINVSEYDRKLAIKYKVAPEEKLVTIKNGLDINYFFNNLCSKEEARKKITDIIFNDEFLISKINKQQKDLGGFWIGSIGRLVKEKNYQLFVEAVKILKENFQKEEEKLSFFIIGDGYEKETLKLKMKNLEL